MGELTLTGDKLVVAIRTEHEAASAAARSALEHALECGRLLAQARAEVPHGSWENYLTDTCGIAARTGRLYLRLHAHRDRLGDRQRVAEISVRQAARLLETPKVNAEIAADERSGELAEIKAAQARARTQRPEPSPVELQLVAAHAEAEHLRARAIATCAEADYLFSVLRALSTRLPEDEQQSVAIFIDDLTEKLGDVRRRVERQHDASA